MSKFLTKQELINKLKNVELLCVDIDGTLTDGGMYLDEQDVIMKKFYAHDGTGMRMVENIGVKVAFVTTSEAKIVTSRAKILGIENVVLGSNTKGVDIIKLCEKLGVNPKNTIHMGDDVNDILGFQSVGLPIAVANGVECIFDFVCYKTQKNGGQGAVREICDLILLAKTGKLYGPPYLDHFVQ